MGSRAALTLSPTPAALRPDADRGCCAVDLLAGRKSGGAVVNGRHLRARTAGWWSGLPVTHDDLFDGFRRLIGGIVRRAVQRGGPAVRPTPVPAPPTAREAARPRWAGPICSVRSRNSRTSTRPTSRAGIWQAFGPGGGFPANHTLPGPQVGFPLSPPPNREEQDAENEKGRERRRTLAADGPRSGPFFRCSRRNKKMTASRPADGSSAKVPIRSTPNPSGPPHVPPALGGGQGRRGRISLAPPPPLGVRWRASPSPLTAEAAGDSPSRPDNSRAPGPGFAGRRHNFCSRTAPQPFNGRPTPRPGPARAN
jgi:hypothetical protein